MNRLVKIIVFSFVLSLLIGLLVYFNTFTHLFLFSLFFVVIFCGFYFFDLFDKPKNSAEINSNPFKKEKDSLELLQDLSHEMKTPLFSIQGYIETLLDGAIEDKNVRLQYLKNMSNAADRLIALISDLDTIHELEKEEILLHHSSFDAMALVEEIFELLNYQAKENNVILRKPTQPEKAMVLADRNRIAQVFSNLVSNAIIYSDSASVVTISFEEEPNHWKITVSDTGIGISKEDIKHIFNRFYRADKSRNRKKGGSGLGLTIVKQILLAHKKEISVKTVLGEGTSFYFELDKG